MTAAYPANTNVDTGYTNGAATDSPALGGFLERFFGSDQATAIRTDLKDRAVEAKDMVKDRALVAKDSLSQAGASVTSAAKAHPVLAIAAVVGGIAAIGLLANPATRRAAIAGGAGLWSKYGHLLTPKTPAA